MKFAPLKKYFSKILSSFTNGIASLFVTMNIPKALGPELFGIYNYLFGSFNDLFQFFDFGVSHAFFTNLSGEKNKKGIIRFYSIITLIILISVFTVVTLSYLTPFRDYIFKNIQLIFIFSVFALCASNWIYQLNQKTLDSLGKTVEMEIARSIVGVVKVISLFIFLALIEISLINFIFYMIYCSVLGNLSCLIMFFKFAYQKDSSLLERGTPLKSRYLLKKMIIFIAPLLFYTIISSGVSLLERYLLQYFGGAQQQGFFALGTYISTVCILLTTAAIPILHRQLSINDYTSTDSSKSFNLIFNTIPIFLVISTFISAIAILNIDSLLLLIGGESFQGAKTAVILMLIYPIHQTYGQLVGTVFYSFSLTKLYSKIGIYRTLIGLLLTCFLLLPSKYLGLDLGATGLALKMVSLQFVFVNLSLYLVTKEKEWNIYKLFQQQVLVGLTVLTISYISYISCNSYLKIENLYINLCVQSLFSVLIGLTLFLFLKEKDIFKKNIIDVNQLLDSFDEKKSL